MMVNQQLIQNAYQRLKPYIRKTPILEVAFEDVFLSLKLELLQHTGTFKPRGAFNHTLNIRIPDAGLVAASGGNHGIAVAYVAKQLGTTARIYVPSISSPFKQSQIRTLGAEIHVVGDTYADALDASLAYAQSTGALNIGAYHHEDVIAGQGTIALEWETQTPELDTILISTGGAGLVAGVCAWHQGKVNVVSVEPENCPSLNASWKSKQLVEVQTSGIAADSLGARQISPLALEITEAYLHNSILVSDEDIQNAQQWLWQEYRIVTEPGGATAFAALLSNKYLRQAGERIGVLLCGGNIDLQPSSA